MKQLTLLALVCLFAACGSGEGDSSPAAEPVDAAPASAPAPSVGAEIATGMNNQMDRAKNVENQVMQQKARIDEAVDGEKKP